MNDFIERCRQEWKRLGVPDPVAEEMATDLGADLAEAAAEGVSAEEYLGRSAFDPGAFAASWAAERGVIPVPPAPAGRRRWPLGLVAFTVVAALALVIAVLLLAAGQPQVSLVATGSTQRGVLTPPGAPPPTVSRQVLHTNSSAPVEWILLVLAVVALGFAAWLWSSWGRPRPPAAPAG
jgi:hypothetical protein